jgi:acetyltransferase-like isoleucine patch superfamily enzyme
MCIRRTVLPIASGISAYLYNMKAKIKYTPINKRTYETSNLGIGFSVTINGRTASGHWSPCGQYVSNGVDVNELVSLGKRFTIFKNGGGHRSYEISASLARTEKQPRNLRFTGHTLSVSNLRGIFVGKIQDALEGRCKADLSPEFLEFFGLQVL